jgi:putative glutamine amidotransferase
MKKNYSKRLYFIALFILGTLSILWFTGCKTTYQPPERFFDNAEPFSDEVRLAILYPSSGSIRAMSELREQGLISLENLTVIGVYHENERTDYQRSIEFVRNNNLRWFKFHKISGELNKDNLFLQNSCSEEFEKIFNKSDGIVFFGGEDIPTATFWSFPSFFISSGDSRTKITHLFWKPSQSFLFLEFVSAPKASTWAQAAH